MKKFIIVLLLLSSINIEQVFCQSEFSLGIRVGSLKFQNWEFEKGNIPLNGSTKGRYYLGAYPKMHFAKNYSVGLGFDLLAANESISFKFSGPGGGGPFYTMFALSPSISKDVFLVQNKLGFTLQIGAPITFLQTSTFVLDEQKLFGVIVQKVEDENGNIVSVPTFDIKVSGTRTVDREVALYIRPELGVFYHISPWLKATVSHMRGFNLGKPLIYRNLDTVVYQEETFAASDHFKGNYWSTMIGVELQMNELVNLYKSMKN